MTVLAAILAGVGWADVASAETVSLRELAQSRGIAFGSAVSAASLAGDASYARTLGSEFGVVTPEDAMKWAVLRPARDTFRWGDADAIVDAAVANGQGVRGHTLVWHSSLPAWLTGGSFTTTELRDVLKEHVQTTVRRYAGRVKFWDVANEVLNNDGSPRAGFWLERLGEEYIADVFRWAHEADPAAVLYLNEYGAETHGPKADALYALVRSLKEQGVPIHGVGLQAHLTGSSRPDQLPALLRRFTGLDVDVAVTELDVRIPVPVTPAGLASQAEVYRQVTAACLAVARCVSITVWGFTDRRSWIGATYPGWGAATLFDDDLATKPAYRSVADVLTRTDPNAPVGHWPLDDPAGTVAADVSGNGHDATVRGAKADGRVPHVTAFAGDGATTEASTGAPVLNTDGSFTVSAWVSMYSTGVPGVVASQDGETRSAFYLMYQKSTGRWEFTVPSADGTEVTWLTARSASAPVLKRWTHLTGVYEAPTRQLRLYVDGVPDGTRDGVTAWRSTKPFRIGRSLSGGRFDGAISDVRAWNRALPAGEVTGISDRTVAAWGFDNAAIDSSPFGRGTSLNSSGATYDSNALKLDGTGCAEGYGPALRTDRSWTITARVNLAAKGAARTVISQSGTVRDAFYLQYHQSYDRWAVIVPSADATGSDWQQVLSTAPPALNTWTTLSAVYDAQAATLALHVDGVRQGDPLPAVKSWPSTGRIHIGCSGTGGRFNGLIDDVKAYVPAA
ncbi:hypothetical protein GCM10009828_040790 [Actinoplanes couchii]|uniref:Beta-xylanase n=1 Tax=Actinoplanes couchii TaxID=403638 RepID=A0ABQ3XGM1_9ACTN|nr:hypothetical protein Aco03nite_060540 [Actinoplanes couchii]